ncbi:hypothetical protein GGR57DRAFT_385153 [Xylariaceae sp. FL1272]|nr:hypothetical protein GGR57DRAFT_385153 [Xylariaceae sp. FL1272]
MGLHTHPSNNPFSMPVAFGFSVGDFVAVIELIVKTCEALDDASGSSQEYQHVARELKNFKSVITTLQQTTTETGPNQHTSQLPTTLRDCSKAVDDLNNFLCSQNGMSSPFRKVLWAIRGKQKLESLRSRILSNMMLLSVLQQNMHSNAINDTRAEVIDIRNEVSRQIQQSIQAVQIHVPASFPCPYDQQPIKFQDVKGRRYPIPLEVIPTFKDLIAFLIFGAKDDPILSHFVDSNEIWLFTPGGQQEHWWYLIQEVDWSVIARPGMTLGMSIRPLSLCPNHQVGHQHHDHDEPKDRADPLTSCVRFIKPLPHSVTYDANTKFRYL